jgi:hypothetical protein
MTSIPMLRIAINLLRHTNTPHNPSFLRHSRSLPIENPRHLLQAMAVRLGIKEVHRQRDRNKDDAVHDRRTTSTGCSRARSG